VDSPRRSLMKALLWQLMGIVSTGLIGAAFTGSFRAGGLMAMVNAVIGLLVYLVYERAWSHISWGRSRDKGGERQIL